MREFFHYRCARCELDCTSAASQLQVHHIDKNPGNNAFENLIPLCAVCHLQVEKEARLHAPNQERQAKMFAENTYLSAMQRLRESALARLARGSGAGFPENRGGRGTGTSSTRIGNRNDSRGGQRGKNRGVPKRKFGNGNLSPLPERILGALPPQTGQRLH